MESLIFKNINVVDVKNGKIEEAVDVVCRGGVIAAVGKGAAVSEAGGLSADESEAGDVTVIDGEGKYLAPGIIDMHVHITWDGSADPVGLDNREGVFQAMNRGLTHARQCLEAGVTTIREVGSMADVAVEAAYAINKGYAKGAEIIPCGSAIQSVYGHVPAVGTIADSDGEIIKAVRGKKILLTEKEIPCQWIKIMATGGAAGMEEVGPSMYSQEQLQLIVSEAHRLHMKVAAHAVSREGIIECIKAGIDTIEHGADIPEEYLEMMKEKGLTLVPTLAIYKILAGSAGIVPDKMVEKSRKVTEHQKKTFAKAMELGVRIALGTDAGSPNFGPHPSAFKEMFIMNEYGMSREDVVKSATITNAEVLGIGSRLGSVEAGKQADLLLLGGNPYSDLHMFTEQLLGVYKAGKRA